MHGAERGTEVVGDRVAECFEFFVGGFQLRGPVCHPAFQVRVGYFQCPVQPRIEDGHPGPFRQRRGEL